MDSAYHTYLFISLVERFPNHRLARQRFLGQLAIGFENQGDGLAEILSCFLQRIPLGIRPRKLFD